MTKCQEPGLLSDEVSPSGLRASVPLTSKGLEPQAGVPSEETQAQGWVTLLGPEHLRGRGRPGRTSFSKPTSRPWTRAQSNVPDLSVKADGLTHLAFVGSGNQEGGGRGGEKKGRGQLRRAPKAKTSKRQGIHAYLTQLPEKLIPDAL